MNREIKFRAWNGREMFNVDVLAISPCTWDCPDHGKRGASLAYQPHIKVMQYTGLKDKNGKEIYEGDIVATDDYAVAMLKHWGKKPKEKISLYEIRFFEGRYMLFDKNNWIAVLNHHVMSKAKELTVVGNIYENPELLEVNQ